MKKWKIALLILLGTVLAAGILAVVTCPDRLTHKEAIMDVLNEKIAEGILDANNGKTDEISIFLGSIGSSMVSYFIEGRFSVKNHFVYSVGYLKDTEGVDRPVSVGVFGHIFTFSKEELDSYLNDNVGEKLKSQEPEPED